MSDQLTNGKTMNIMRVSSLLLMLLFCVGTVQSFAEDCDPYSFEELTQKAEQGDVGAQYLLGTMYYIGKGGIVPDFMAASKWVKGTIYYDEKGIKQDINEAGKWVKKAADQGDSDAQYLLGNMYYDGQGAPQDFKEAREWIGKAADQGNADAHYFLGWMHYWGKGTKQDFKEAIKWHKKAAELGHIYSQLALANMYFDGKGVQQDKEEAVKWYKKVAELGVGGKQSIQIFTTSSQYKLGSLYYRGEGISQSYKEAAKWYKIAAEKGDASAQYELGWLYYIGGGVVQDKKKAVKWYRKAAEQGDDKSILALGILHATVGDDKKIEQWLELAVTEDITKTIEWYQYEADQGYAEAQFGLALLFLKRELKNETPQISNTTITWVRKAAEQDFALAQFLLGELYSNSEDFGVAQNKREAFKWYWNALNQGLSLAREKLAYMYYKGEGTIQNETMAYALWSLAAVEGHENAKKSRDRVAKKLSKEELKQGRKIAADLLRKIDNKEPTNLTIKSKQKDTITEPEVSGSGSAFIITNNGYIVTCYHVIKDASKIVISTSNKEYPAKLIRADKLNDIALLKIDGAFSALSFASRNSVKMGSDVFTIGYPNPIMQGVNQKLTEGDINALTGYQDDIRLYQISVPVQSGNSGGALLNENGDVVGIIVSMLKAEVAFKITGNMPQNVNYALKSTYAQALIDTVAEAIDSLQKPHRKKAFGEVVERVKKSVVMVLAYE